MSATDPEKNEHKQKVTYDGRQHYYKMLEKVTLEMIRFAFNKQPDDWFNALYNYFTLVEPYVSDFEKVKEVYNNFDKIEHNIYQSQITTSYNKSFFEKQSIRLLRQTTRLVNMLAKNLWLPTETTEESDDFDRDFLRGTEI